MLSRPTLTTAAALSALAALGTAIAVAAPVRVPVTSRNASASLASAPTATGSTADAAPSPRPAQVGRPSAGTLTLDWGDVDVTAAHRGNYAVLQPWEHHRLEGLRARNPEITILMYKDVSAVRRDAHESGLFSTGLSYPEARAGGWLLQDAGGRTIEWSDYPGLFPVDIAADGYQDQWARNVIGELDRYGWDGVLMDDTLTTLSHDTVGNRRSVEIGSDTQMYAATESFLADVATRVRDRGFMAVPNVTVEHDTWQDTLSDWSRYVSGWENEFFVKWGLGTQDRFTGADWRWKTRMAAWCARRDLPFLAVTYSDVDDVAAQVYHRATWLLTWNGRTGSSIFVPQQDGVDHWRPAATTRIGAPAGPPRVVAGANVHRRDYTRGVVLVNPGTRARRVRLGGEYRTGSGREVTSVRVGSARGVILQR